MIYRIPPQPPWLIMCWVEHPLGWLGFIRDGEEPRPWSRHEPNRPAAAPVKWFSWRDLLEMGDVSDANPNNPPVRYLT